MSLRAVRKFLRKEKEKEKGEKKERKEKVENRGEFGATVVELHVFPCGKTDASVGRVGGRSRANKQGG